MGHMKTWRRIMIAMVMTTVPIGTASPSWAAPTTTTTTPLAAAVASTGVAPAGNQVVESWALSPAIDATKGGDRPNLSYEVPPGAEVNDKVTLYNLSNVQMTFQLYATDALNNSDGGFDLLPGNTKPTGVGTWVTMPQANITLQPRTQATMPITIKVPVTALPGDHAGGIVASSTTQGTGPDGKVVLLDRRTGPRVYVRVAGPLSPRLTVEKLDTSYKPALSPLDGTEDVTYRIQNRGNVRMGGKQQVSIGGLLGLGGKKKPTVVIPELLPGQGLSMHVTFGSAVATGFTKASVRLDPAPVGSTTGTKSGSWGSFTLAPPYTIFALAVSVWLLLRARRAYLRRNAEQVGVQSYAT